MRLVVTIEAADAIPAAELLIKGLRCFRSSGSHSLFIPSGVRAILRLDADVPAFFVPQLEEVGVRGPLEITGR